MNSIKCAAHTLQLAVRDALECLDKKDKNAINLCRRAAKFLRLQSTKNEMRKIGLTSVYPALDVVTRWSSTYMMVRMITQTIRVFSLNCDVFLTFFRYEIF